MSDKTEHSPLPWQQRDGYMFDCNDEPVPLRPIFGVVATEPGGLRYEDALANAEILARITSLHDKLVAALKHIEAEAMRYAEMYPHHSDGRNTFIIFGNMVSQKMADALASLKE